jgi:hypothetical protein
VKPLLLAIVAVVLALLCARTARAGDDKDRVCDGPPECCPAKLDTNLAAVRTVQVGLVLLGLCNIAERPGTWDADFYFYESWVPEPGFTPQTEITNEQVRASQQFDSTELRDGRCTRTRRIRSTLRSVYNLRTFPFDKQRLVIRFSDDQYDARKVIYAHAPLLAGIDDGVRRQVSGWKLVTDLEYHDDIEAFRWEQGAPEYASATFGLTVRRHVTFHLTKFFLPLIVIVIVSFSVFWIDPEDLSSELGLGVTCLLSAIALQYAEGQTLPEVDYLTLADRVYAVCYSLIGAAVLQSVYANRLARGGARDRALRLDRRSRWAFPAALTAVLILSIVRAFTQA